MKQKIWIIVFTLLILPFVSSSLLAAKYPIKKSKYHFVQQMSAEVIVTVYANSMDIEFSYGNGNRNIKKMYVVSYISLIDIHGNKIFSYRRPQELGPVDCTWFICGKTVTKAEVTSVSFPTDLVSKIHSVEIFIVTNNDGPTIKREMEAIEKTLKGIVLMPLIF